VYEQEDVRAVESSSTHRHREVTANGPDIIIKNKKEKHEY
jgi:hypothetical protein